MHHRDKCTLHQQNPKWKHHFLADDQRQWLINLCPIFPYNAYRMKKAGKIFNAIFFVIIILMHSFFHASQEYRKAMLHFFPSQRQVLAVFWFLLMMSWKLLTQDIEVIWLREDRFERRKLGFWTKRNGIFLTTTKVWRPTTRIVATVRERTIHTEKGTYVRIQNSLTNVYNSIRKQVVKVKKCRLDTALRSYETRLYESKWKSKSNNKLLQDEFAKHVQLHPLCVNSITWDIQYRRVPKFHISIEHNLV